MSKIAVSKASIKHTLLVCGVVVMFLVTIVPNNVGAASNNITLDSNITTADIMEGGNTIATLTLTSSDTVFRKMEIFLVANFPGGTSWDTAFFDVNGDPVSVISLSQGASFTVQFMIFCTGDCKAGDTNNVQVYGRTDPRWYDGDTDSGAFDPGCHLTNDCKDNSPASASLNETNTIAISLTARTSYASSVTCDTESNSGDNLMHQGQNYLWGYTLTNTGWNDDSYTFTSVVTSDSGINVDLWDVKPGLTNGKQLTGQSDSSTTAVHKTDGSISITPASSARPGVYGIDLTIKSLGGGSDATCAFDIIIPEPDLEVKDTDITFSHTGAWINTRGDSQKITIYAKVRNNGGSMDQAGVSTTDIVVTFYVDGAQLGTPQTIESLAYGEEKTLEIFWNPAREHDSDEVGIPITVSIDTSDNIQESDNDNNEGNAFFKVVRTKASNPSFYMGFISLIGAVGAAVLLSTYYRNKDLDN